MIITYMLYRVGLKLSVDLMLCHCLVEFRVPLACCKTNMLWILLGLTKAGVLLKVILMVYNIARVYILSVVDIMSTLSFCPGERFLVESINQYNNKGWDKFSKVVVSRDWLLAEHNPLIMVLDRSSILASTFRIRKESMSEDFTANRKEVQDA